MVIFLGCAVRIEVAVWPFLSKHGELFDPEEFVSFPTENEMKASSTIDHCCYSYLFIWTDTDHVLTARNIACQLTPIMIRDVSLMRLSFESILP